MNPFFVSTTIVLGCLGLRSLCAENEIGYIETFALSDDRDAALKQLVPGSEEFYFHTGLHLQNQGKRAEFEALMAQWAKRQPDSAMRRHLETRQALIDYGVDPKRTLDFIAQRLNLQFGHQRERPSEKPDLPTALDPKLITTDEFFRLATQNVDHLKNLADYAVEALVRSGRKLSTAQRRDALSRIQRPDVPNLLALINEDLAAQESRGFGEFPIHRNLLRAQLDELLKLRPDLAGNQNFVFAYLGKLSSGADENIERDPAARQAWLDRAWAFVSGLGDPFTSLKAHVLYQRLDHDRRLGTYDAKRFLDYVKLPRAMPYVNPRWQRDERAWRHPADLNADFSAITRCPPIGSDVDLVRDYLLRLLAGAKSPDEYAPYFEDKWLKAVFAEAKLTAGTGNADELAALLTPAAFEALKNRIDLDFDLANPAHFPPGDAVNLDVWVKNVPKLIVKVFELNTPAYYETRIQPISTDIDLDGLVAGHEVTIAYDDAPLRRTKRQFKFPEIKPGRGVWVVEFIGNGRASRALIRKGQLRYVTRPSTAGTVLTILDEKNEPVARGFATMQGRRFEADTNGEITIPFSNEPGSRQVVLNDGAGFATIENISLAGEAYTLEAGFHVSRERLIMGKKAAVAIRPRLSLNGLNISAALLDKARLTITSTDLDGLPTTQTIAPFKLVDDREVLHEFSVPERLASVRFELSGSVKSLSQSTDLDLATDWTFVVNEIDRSEHVGDLFFGKADGAFFIEQRGRNGEVFPERAVTVKLTHRDYAVPVTVALKTDAQARVALGPLDGIGRVEANAATGLSRSWSVHEAKVNAASQIHAVAGQPVRLPVIGAAEFSLLEVRHGTYTRDWRANVEIKDGFAELKELPPGDYVFHSLREGRAINLRIAQGAAVRRFVISPARMLELSTQKPLHIPSIAVEGEELVIRVTNADPFTRVHVTGTRYQPAFPFYDRLGLFPAPPLLSGTVPWPQSQFVSGRDIGDELRYILERKGARRFPGVMLDRPGVLLNPWAVRDTSTTTQEARSGEAFRKLAQAPGQALDRAAEEAKAAGPGRQTVDPHTLDFLAEPAPITYNGGVEADGVARIKLADLGGSTQVHVLALNAQSSVYRELSLPAKPVPTRDLRLAGGLDPKAHFAQKDEVTILEKDKPFTIDDALATKFEVYGDLGRAYTLLRTLSNNATLEEFRFVLDWTTFDAKKKSELYSKYASHELSFFLARKDPDFFTQVIQPYLRNKKDRTFIDEYLLGADLRKFLEPWRHGQLNIVERILLGRRIVEETANELRALEDIIATIPQDREEERRKLEVALRGFALAWGEAGGGGKGLDEVRQQLGQLGERESVEKLADLDKRADAGLTVPETAAAAPPAPAGGAVADEKARGLGAAGRAGKPQTAMRRAGAEPESRAMLRLKRAPDRLLAEQLDVQSNGLASLAGAAPADPFAAPQLETAFGMVADLSARMRAVDDSFFRKLDTTKEWAENNYWHLLIGDQNAALVTTNKFWLDFARHKEGTPFLSTHVAAASRNFTEMMLALAVLDLPFPKNAVEPDAKLEDKRLTLTPKAPLLVYHQAVRPAEVDNAGPKLLVSQNFYRWGDRYIQQGAEKLDKFVTEEFLTGVVYGCQLVVTNPTSSNQKLDLIFQIPEGSRPAVGARATNSRALRLEPFRTETLDIAFYFPRAGTFNHFPVHISREGKVVAFAEPFAFKVVDELSKPDTASWAYVSQNGTDAEVIAFLDQHNLLGLDLDKIAWRLGRSGDFFHKVIDLLQRRRVYHPTTYSYGVRHNDAVAVREFLRHEGSLVGEAGPWLQSALVVIDPVERKSYEHLEYKPLVNARTHRLGPERTILNDRFREQYQRLLAVLACKPALDDTDRLAVTYYLLVQDRIEEALAFFVRVDRAKVATALQYDYAQAWLALAQEDTRAAREVAARHAAHPVDKWREKFGQMIAQLDEIEGRGPQVTTKDDREQMQAVLASKQPSFELKAQDRDLRLESRNLTEVTVNYYLMDLEFLFSTNPFVGQDSGRFAQIKPNMTETLKLDPGAPPKQLRLPRAFQNRNVLVEVVAAGQRKSQAVYANDLKSSLSESYGQVQVRHSADDRPLPKVYVKVYAEVNGQPRFYKDGYTDLRGRFDYATLSTNEIDNVGRFSILILSDTHGAMVREARPPQR